MRGQTKWDFPSTSRPFADRHLLPFLQIRSDELSPEVDTDQRAAYIRQMAHGVHVRQALLAMVLGEV